MDASSGSSLPAIRSDLPFGEAKQVMIDACERCYLRDAMERTGGNLTEASRQIGLDRKHLRTLLKKHGLRSDS